MTHHTLLNFLAVCKLRSVTARYSGHGSRSARLLHLDVGGLEIVHRDAAGKLITVAEQEQLQELLRRYLAGVVARYQDAFEFSGVVTINGDARTVTVDHTRSTGQSESLVNFDAEDPDES